MRKYFAALALFLVSALPMGCKAKQPNETPEGAVRELVEQLRRLDGTSRVATLAFELLSDQSKQNLIERAERYSAASGKHIEPEMMLAPASFILRFSPRELSSEIKGSYAIVHARGLLEDEHAEIRCVFENGGWHVQIDLPPLPPVVMRPRDAEGPARR